LARFARLTLRVATFATGNIAPATGVLRQGNCRKQLMANPHKFLEDWVRESVEATPYRNKAEARRLTYECRKAAQQADLSWSAVIRAAGGDVEGYILAALQRAADQEAEHV
jgi:hypothetical protein